MNTLLDSLGPAVWRASWQAGLLALVVGLLLWMLGERMTPRWRYLLWSVVMLRLLCLVTPASPWSVFNLARLDSASAPRPVVVPSAAQDTAVLPWPEAHGQRPADATRGPAAGEPQSNAGFPDSGVVANQPGQVAIPGQVESSAHVPTIAATAAAAPASAIRSLSIGQWATACWCVGCLVCLVRLGSAACVLRRRLSLCRTVTDPRILDLLNVASRQIGLRRTPDLLVTPEPVSPCLVGTWRPRIVVPESLISDASQPRGNEGTLLPLRQVLAHELAHLARGDHWTNWLLFAAGTLHWFNPLAWWALHELREERESACDDLALAAAPRADRRNYVETLLAFVAGRSPSPVAPGLIGLFSSQRSLMRRMKRVLQTPLVSPFRPVVAAAAPLLLCLLGLTDAMPADEPADALRQPPASATRNETPVTSAAPQAEPTDYVIFGQCVDNEDRSPLAGVRVRLFVARGLVAPPEEIAETISDGEGRFRFAGLARPREEMHLDRLQYAVVAQAPGRPPGVAPEIFRKFHPRNELTISVGRKTASLTGRVTDRRGRPVSGATVFDFDMGGRPLLGLHVALTDADGQFAIANLAAIDPDPKRPEQVYLRIVHPDYPVTTGTAAMLPADVEFVLPDGCKVTGQVLHKLTGRPAPGVVVAAEHNRHVTLDRTTTTDAAGRFKLTVAEGDYNFLVESADAVCVAVTDRDCQAGQTVDLPPLLLTSGGFISGRVVNTATGEPVARSEAGDPIRIGLFGPAQPPRKGVISPKGLVLVDDAGNFTIRAAAGENFPFLVNTRGQRMAWDTQEQAPIVVTEGETVSADILIVPEKTPAEKMEAARSVVAGLSDRTEERVAQIIGEFRKLNHTVDETELWCLLMRELVTIGPDAVPQLCEELDLTTEQRHLRRLGFALRAIGDPRAVPALIRAIPRTLLPASSDYGLIVEDAELTRFMQMHHLRDGGGQYFGFGRPVREIVGALHKLTGQDFEDETLYSMHLSADPRGQVLQRRLYHKQARLWAAWWEAHWREFTNDEAYARAELQITDEPLPPAVAALSSNASTQGVWSGMVLSPPDEQGRYVNHLMDLDTSLQPGWPKDIPQNEAAIGQEGFSAWAAENGVDLMCVTYTAPDGTESYVLRVFDMQVREIGPRDLRNLERLVRAGTLPEGRPVGELLLHHNAESQTLKPENGAFLFVTREGTMGVIEVTDRVTRVADLTGAGGAPAGVGFHKGVRFNLTRIVP